MNTFESLEEGRRTDRSPSKRGYRWVCPLCGVSAVHPLSAHGKNALRALKTHVYFSEGNGHGERETYPRERPEEDLGDYVYGIVVEIGERRA